MHVCNKKGWLYIVLPKYSLGWITTACQIKEYTKSTLDKPYEVIRGEDYDKGQAGWKFNEKNWENPLLIFEACFISSLFVDINQSVVSTNWGINLAAEISPINCQLLMTKDQILMEFV